MNKNQHTSAIIHPTAIIDESAVIQEYVKIGPYCIVGKDVEISSGTVLHSHIVVKKNTFIGRNNEIFQFASIGEDCQDLKYDGEETQLVIGDNNKIRESCSIHRGTAQDKGITQIGSNNLFMVNTHIAHDCIIGDNNIFANNVGVAGHVKIANDVIIGGNSGIHQFCKIDSHSLIGGGSVILKDVIAFSTVSGNPAKNFGLNTEGMRRRGWTEETINHLKQASKIIFRSNLTTAKAIEHLQSELLPVEPKVELLIQSLSNTSRGITR